MSKVFEIPLEIERFLASLSKLYAQDGKRQLQEIVVNASTRVQEEWTYDGWNGGTYGHALFLELPGEIFLNCVKQRDSIQDQLKKDINSLHNLQNEYIAERIACSMHMLRRSEHAQAGTLETCWQGSSVTWIHSPRHKWMNLSKPLTRQRNYVAVSVSMARGRGTSARDWCPT